MELLTIAGNTVAQILLLYVAVQENEVHPKTAAIETFLKRPLCVFFLEKRSYSDNTCTTYKIENRGFYEEQISENNKKLLEKEQF